MSPLPLLFLHAAGPQSATESSGPLLSALHDVPIAAPALPAPDDPDPAAWEEAVRAEINRLEQPTVVVGHSLGGSVALRALALAAEALPGTGARRGDPRRALLGRPRPGVAGRRVRPAARRRRRPRRHRGPAAPWHRRRGCVGRPCRPAARRIPSAAVRRIAGMDHAAARHAGRIAEVLRPIVGIRTSG